MVEDIEAFTCVMYGQACEKSVNNVRSIMLKKMIGEDEMLTTRSKVDLSRPHQYSGVPSPMILAKAWKRLKRVPWNQYGLVALSSPLHSLTCWRKQLRRWMEMVKKTRSKTSIMKTCCMMNRHH